ncbi:MAG: hypothetical protein KDA89_00555 [Planctomycetaceae bacterium]|nr:hypothetical protein [Planctomycetaceae bacterium]
MGFIYRETWTTVRPVRPVFITRRSPPTKDPLTAAAMLALIGAVVGGVASGSAGGAALGFLAVCFIWSCFREQENNT